MRPMPGWSSPRATREKAPSNVRHKLALAADLEATRQRRTDRGQWDEVADLEVPRAADHLHAVRPVVDAHPSYPVCPVDRSDLDDACHHHVGKALPHHDHLLDDQAEVVERGGQVDRVSLERGEIS